MKDLSASDLERLREDDPELFVALLTKLREKWEAEQEPNYVKAMFPKQRAFFEDKAKKKAALCSRRAGKTFGLISCE